MAALHKTPEQHSSPRPEPLRPKTTRQALELWSLHKSRNLIAQGYTDYTGKGLCVVGFEHDNGHLHFDLAQRALDFYYSQPEDQREFWFMPGVLLLTPAAIELRIWQPVVHAGPEGPQLQPDDGLLPQIVVHAPYDGDTSKLNACLEKLVTEAERELGTHLPAVGGQ